MGPLSNNAGGLSELPLTDRTVHLCVDMQVLFSDVGPWPTPWLNRVLPIVTEIAGRFPERTIFTRFITPQRPDEMPGMWRPYYQRWHETTREHLHPDMLELMPQLHRFVPPAHVIDKMRYSAFAEQALVAHLQERDADGLIVTGSETDVCVLATVLGAVDFGYRVVLVTDAICSSSDEGHDAMLEVYHRRFAMQIETAEARTVLARWHR
ncbi:MAG: cysteine hydrolase [Rhizobiales bacterium]|nr:cysteine hydrolase [Hyphomicrobiales bacterium]